MLLEAVSRRHGYDFRNYPGASLQRRIRRAMQLERVQTISALEARVLRDLEALRRFVSCLPVNVIELFRDPLL
ncbi:MAG: hypothetical protein DWQ36_09670 [Acidobacteria bacterium]|nr:MAG: hypothetical protein DWQ30_00950 [Acidobacteriota bacterium]REK08329.1 MAG: hypothetical protein DWQ36_09670 [Acidobacteriota bacterium]